jgi:glyoxylase-like metal-dependent hydrolase (beta-lactamase superfamily II)
MIDSGKQDMFANTSSPPVMGSSSSDNLLRVHLEKTLRNSASISTLGTVDSLASSNMSSSPPPRPSSTPTSPYDGNRRLYDNDILPISAVPTGRPSITSIASMNTLEEFMAGLDDNSSIYGGSKTTFRAFAPTRVLYRLTCRANDNFHNQRYKAAQNDYTKAIKLLANGEQQLADLIRTGGETADFAALIYANRSATRCLLNDFEGAKSDAEMAIRIRPNWDKGFYHKGEAYLGLRRYEDALRCYIECLERNPANLDARVGMTTAETKLEDARLGLFIMQLLSGREIALQKSIRPIQNKIFEFATNMRNFIYIIADTDTRDCVVVDACWDVPGILQIIKREKLNLVGAIVTHHHFDHVGGIPPPPFDQFRIRVSGLSTLLKKKPNLIAYVHQLDMPELLPANPNLPLSRILQTTDGYVLHLGKRTTIQFIHTPGHTPGSQCLLVNGRRLFTGDTLFLGCCGRLDLPGGDPTAMWHSLRRLSQLDDNLIIYPGHEYGGEWSILQEERLAGALKECTLEEWLRQQQSKQRSSVSDETSSDGQHHGSEHGEAACPHTHHNTAHRAPPSPVSPIIGGGAVEKTTSTRSNAVAPAHDTTMTRHTDDASASTSSVATTSERTHHHEHQLSLPDLAVETRSISGGRRPMASHHPSGSLGAASTDQPVISQAATAHEVAQHFAKPSHPPDSSSHLTGPLASPTPPTSPEPPASTEQSNHTATRSALFTPVDNETFIPGPATSFTASDVVRRDVSPASIFQRLSMITVDDDTDDELPSEEVAWSIVPPIQVTRPPVTASCADSIHSFGLENDSYPSEDDDD